MYTLYAGSAIFIRVLKENEKLTFDKITAFSNLAGFLWAIGVPQTLNRSFYEMLKMKGKFKC